MPVATCPECGYDLAGLPGSGDARPCPECGQTFLPSEAQGLRWARRKLRVPLTISALGVGLFAGMSALCMVSGNLSALLVVLLFIPVFGVVNWIVTAIVWAKADGSNAGPDRFGVYFLAALTGFLFGIATAISAFISALITLKLMGFENALGSIPG